MGRDPPPPRDCTYLHCRFTFFKPGFEYAKPASRQACPELTAKPAAYQTRNRITANRRSTDASKPTIDGNRNAAA